ncbi:MAG TPA: polysaccharide deacetylase family protein [Chryseosolibacter sp.]
MRRLHLTLFLLLFACISLWAQEQTYAEKLGFPKGSKVLILHVDDVGMSWDSNEGAINAIEKGVATSLSVMMPCPWVPGFLHYLKNHPNTDAGLHLTLTSEWKDYRWGPLKGKPAVPGLVDSEGALWPSVEEVMKHASADEVEQEIRAQLERARQAGFEPTHLDSHMGTLFATPEFMQRYLKVGIENKIPVMFPGGHNTMISRQMNMTGELRAQLSQTAQLLWNAGLPVLDDLHNVSYAFDYPTDSIVSDAELQKIATQNYIKTIGELKPGLTMVIMHCTQTSEIFPKISDSGKIRRADMLAMMDPEFKQFLQREKVVLTTWKELKQKRANLK